MSRRVNKAAEAPTEETPQSVPGERAYDAPREEGGNVRPADGRFLNRGDSDE